MKIITALCFSIVMACPAMAQNAREGNVRFKSEDRNGVMADYDAPKDITEAALAKTLSGADIGKKNNESSFWKYEGVTWPAISPEKVDVYFNVERHKGSSIVYMMVSTGYGNFVTSASNPAVIANMKTFLTNFKGDLDAYMHQMEIEHQKQVVADADKQLRKDDRSTDRANRRQKKADKQKDKSQEDADEQKKKLEELEKNNH